MTERIGGSVSWTLTDCWHEALLPLLSVAVQMTRLVPIGRTGGALLTTAGAGSQASVAVAKPAPTAVAGHSSTASAGQVIVGGVVSWKLTGPPHSEPVPSGRHCIVP